MQPVLVIIEDLHWIDTETQACLDRLADNPGAAPLLLLVTYRPEYQDAWIGKTNHTQLRLDSLALESADELLDTLLGHDVSLDPLKRLIAGTTGRNPLFMEESVRTLVETQGLAGERGAYRLTRSVDAIQVPATVQAILAARIDRLPAEDKRVLEMAAVIGQTVSFTLLETVADVPDLELQQRLGHLRTAELLYQTRSLPAPEYAFKHALTHEVAYSTLLAERRRVLHAKVVETIEAGFADRLSEHVEQLAHHSFRAEVWTKALRYMRQAGQKAASRSAHREAVACLDQALAALAHLPEDREALEQAIDLRFELVTSLFPLAELFRLPAMLDEAARMADSIGDRRRLGQALWRLGTYYFEAGQSESAIDYAERALATAQDLSDSELEAGATFRLGQIHLGLGNHARAIDLFVQTVASPHGQPLSTDRTAAVRLSVAARAFLARALNEVGEFRQAALWAEEAITLSEGRDEAFDLALGCHALGLTHLRQGDVVRAISVLERGLGVARAGAVSFLLPMLGTLLGYALALVGRTQEALGLLEQAVDETRSTRIWPLVFAQEILAQVNLACGREGDAAVTAGDALDASRRIRTRSGEARILVVLADIAASGTVADFDKAQSLYREALDLADELGMRPLVAHCHLGLGKLYRRTGRKPDAESHLALATALYREMDMRFWLEQAQAEQKA